MARYHINPKTGNVGQCRARQGGCPFGEADHYDTQEEARQVYEKRMAAQESQEISLVRTAFEEADRGVYGEHMGWLTLANVHNILKNTQRATPSMGKSSKSIAQAMEKLDLEKGTRWGTTVHRLRRAQDPAKWLALKDNFHQIADEQAVALAQVEEALHAYEAKTLTAEELQLSFNRLHEVNEVLKRARENFEDEYLRPISLNQDSPIDRRIALYKFHKGLDSLDAL